MATDNALNADSKLSVKLYHNGTFHRFSVDKTKPEEPYAALMAKIRELQPDFNGSLVWEGMPIN